MTIEECYKIMDANYDEALRRFKTDVRLKKFLGMLLCDNSYEHLCQALEEKNYEAAFIAAHTLKGITLNMGITSLALAVSELTEILRLRQDNKNIEPTFQKTRQKYLQMKKALEELFEISSKGAS